VTQYEGQRDTDGAPKAVGVGETPGETGEEEEEGEEVGEGGVGTVIGVLGLCRRIKYEVQYGIDSDRYVRFCVARN